MKSHFRFLSIAVLAVVFAGCGSKSKNTPDPKTEKPSNPSFNIADVWQVSSKNCGEEVVVTKAHEAYRFDLDRIVFVQQYSDTPTTFCKIGYVYDRNIHSFSTGNGVDTEKGILMGSAAKKSCWEKKNGALVEPPVSEVVKFGPEEMTFILTASATSTSIDLLHSKECPDGHLRIVLQKTK